MIPVGPWEPDTPDLASGGSGEALNVIPASRSYRPFPSFAAVSSALGARCQGAVFVRKADGSGVVFAGDATKLYRLSGTSFSDVSRAVGGPYATLADGVWSFVQFGSNILAFNGFDAPQVFNIETDTRFTALAGSPPTALYACVAGDFVMTGNQGGARGRVQWSAINNSADWVTSQQTQASQQDLPDGGWIQGLIGVEYAAIIFQEFAIRRASYEGPPLIFRFSKITDNLGATIPGSLASYRDLIFFCDRSGFFMLQGGAQITPVGEQRVNNEFWSLIDQTNLARVTAAIDPANSLYAIAFPDTSAAGGNPNHVFIYNWSVDRWAHVQPGALDMIFSAATQQGFTLEQLDGVSPSVDALPFSLDSTIWTGYRAAARGRLRHQPYPGLLQRGAARRHGGYDRGGTGQWPAGAAALGAAAGGRADALAEAGHAQPAVRCGELGGSGERQCAGKLPAQYRGALCARADHHAGRGELDACHGARRSRREGGGAAVSFGIGTALPPSLGLRRAGPRRLPPGSAGSAMS